MTTPEVKENFPVCTCTGRLGGQNGRGHHPVMCGHAPTGLCNGIHLSKKLCMHVGKGPRTGQV